MSVRLRKIYCTWGILLCLAGPGLALAEPDVKYIFTVVAWYGSDKDENHVSAEALELEYKSMQECVEAEKRVEAFLDQDNDPKFGYIIIDCAKTESNE